MVSQTDICNFALQNIKATAISSITDSSPQAEACNIRYDSVRKAMLEIQPWKFALARAALSEDSSAPAFGYDNQFTLPTDCLRVVATERQLDNLLGGDPQFNGFLTISNSAAFAQADDYTVEGVKLLSNDDDVKILYIQDITDTTRFSATFVEVMAKALGAAIAYKLTGNRTLAKEERAELLDMVLQSASINSQQGVKARTELSAFLTSRGI